MSDVAISTAPIPADVRAAGAQGRKLYDAALGFEQLLVRTLAAQLAEPRADDVRATTRSGGDAAAGLIRDQIPDALADGDHRERRPRPRARALPRR